jgi:hypothetical protein
VGRAALSSACTGSPKRVSAALFAAHHANIQEILTKAA